MKSFLTTLIIMSSVTAYAGSFHLFCAYQYLDQTSDTFIEKHYLSTVFNHLEPYSRDCSAVRLYEIERKFKKHVFFVDDNVGYNDGFTACNCYSRRNDAKKAHKKNIRQIRALDNSTLRIIRDFIGK